jgi:hypothetical protein
MMKIITSKFRSIVNNYDINALWVHILFIAGISVFFAIVATIFRLYEFSLVIFSGALGLAIISFIFFLISEFKSSRLN